MYFPCLILKQFCTTEIDVILESEELNEDGAPLVQIEWKGKCNYQEKTSRIYKSDKSYITVNATCLIPCEVEPKFNGGSGHVIVHGEKREIASFAKVRNPDGSVNYTEIKLK